MSKLATAIHFEEGAKLAVPAGSESDPFHKLAFFNPRMSFNRSVSSLALGALHEVDAKFDKITLLDGLCATGARGVRYALENKFVKKVFFVDANEHALPLLNKNLKQNKLEKKATAVHSELNEFLANCEEQFDFLEVDPFGTPAPFLENALKKICFGKGKEREYGILSITATDLAALCGKEQQTCVRNYSAKPMKCEFTHEIALRILLGKIALQAHSLGLRAQPVFSFYQGHAVKTMCKIFKAKPSEKNSGKKGTVNTNDIMGFVSYCRNCLAREWSAKKVAKCPACGSKTDFAGPLWIAETSEKRIVEKMLELNLKRKYAESKAIAKFLSATEGEVGLPPFFFDLHEIAARKKVQVPKTALVMQELLKQGHDVSLTHYCPTGIRTDAPVQKIAEIVAPDE